MTRSILFVFAHPDDESHWGSGIAIRCHDEGARTVLVTATRGGRGTNGGLCTNEELTRVREEELREAARILKFDALEILPYDDKEVPNIKPDDIRRRLVGIIRHERPSVLVTFDPDGITLHLDHIALSRFVTDAIPAAADPRWFPELGAPYQVPRLLWTPPVMPWDDGEFPPRPGVDFLIDTSRVVASARGGALRPPDAARHARQAVSEATEVRADAQFRRPAPGVRSADRHAPGHRYLRRDLDETPH